MSEGSEPTIQFLGGSSPSRRREWLLDKYRHAPGDSFQDEFNQSSQGINYSKIIGNCIWIPQSSLAANEILREIALQRGRCQLQPGVRTLAHLAEAVASMVSISWQPLSKIQQQEIIRRFVSEREHQGSLGLLEGLAASRGLVNFLSSRFEQLREIGLTANESTEYLRRNEGRVGNAIAGLYATYCGHLKKNRLFDRAARYELAAKEINNSNCKFALLIIDRWLPDSKIERDLLAALMSNSVDSAVSVYGRPSDSLSERQAWNQFLDRYEIIHERAETLLEEGSSSKIMWASSRIFDSEQEPTESDPSSIELIAATSEHEEARQIARRIKQLLVKQEASTKPIVVATNQISHWNQRLQTVLHEYGIPCASEQAETLSKAPWFQLIFQLVRLKASDWSLEDILAIITRADLKALLPSDRQAAEAVVRSLGLPSGMSYLSQQVQTMASEETDPSSAKQYQQAVGVLEILEQTCQTMPSEATPLEWFDALEAAARELQYSVSNDQIQLNEAAISALQKTMADLEASTNQGRKGPRTLNCDDLVHYFETWSHQLTLKIPIQDEGRVRITSAKNAIGLQADHLFVAGVSESSFSSTPDQYGVSSDPKELLRRQRILFQQLVAMPRLSLVLSYTALDDKAQPRQPSPFVTELERLYPADCLRRETFEIGQLQFKDDACSYREQRLAALKSASEGNEKDLLNVIAQSSDDEAKSLLNNINLITDRWNSETHGSAEGVLSSEKASEKLSKEYGSDHHWSASQLELYANCPYKFFARYVLNAVPFDANRFDIDYRRRGSLLHDAMVEFHTNLMAEIKPEDKFSDLGSQRISEFLHDAIEKVGRGRNLPNHEIALAQIELTETFAWADLYSSQYQKFDAGLEKQITLDEPLKPRYFEARFGPSRSQAADEEVEDSVSTDESYTLELPSGERLLLIGKIDRIDVGKLGDQTLFGIVDYKTGSVGTTKQDQITSGTRLQLALYALAAEELFFPDDDAKLLTTGYWEIKKQGFQGLRKTQTAQIEEGVVETTEEWQSTIDSVRYRVEEMVTGIRKGDFPVYNPDEDCGRSCEFRTVCRINQIRSRDKVWPPSDQPEQPNEQVSESK